MKKELTDFFTSFEDQKVKKAVLTIENFWLSKKHKTLTFSSPFVPNSLVFSSEELQKIEQTFDNLRETLEDLSSKLNILSKQEQQRQETSCFNAGFSKKVSKPGF